MELPNSLKNIVMKQLIGSDSCNELTKNGKECGNKFIYSINDYLFSEEELKKVMIDCTKFCLKHLSNLAINGELLLGYETKERKEVIKIKKESVHIKGIKNGNEKMNLGFFFRKSGKLDKINFYFYKDIVDVKEFEKNMKIKERGSPYLTIVKSWNDVAYDAKFNNGLISNNWKKIIQDCFLHKDLDYINLVVRGVVKNNEYINSVLVLGNLDSINVSSINMVGMRADSTHVFVTGNKIIQR